MLSSNADAHTVVKVTLRELVVFFFFLTLLTYQTFASYSPTHFTLTSQMASLFRSQMDVTNLHQMWDFMETTMLDGIYWEKLYNRGSKNSLDEDNSDDDLVILCPDGHTVANEPCPVPLDDRNIMFESRVLGLPRIRMVKMRNDSCSVSSEFSEAVRVCHGPYDPDNEDKDTVTPLFRHYTKDTAWKYNEAKELGSDAWHSGQLASYAGGGYVQELHYMKNDSLAIVRELRENFWVTQGSRFVVVDLTVYNANVNLFCVIKLTFELPATGGVVPGQHLTALDLLRYTDQSDFVALAIEGILIIFLIYYTVEEVIAIVTLGLNNYLTSLLSLIDLAVLAACGVQVFYSIKLFFDIEPILEEVLAKPFQFADFSYLENAYRGLVLVSSLSLFLGWMKVFKYLSINKTMSQLSDTLSLVVRELSGFFVLFAAIYLAFVQLGFFLFGNQVEDFRSFWDSTHTLFRMILGDFNFRTIDRASPILGPIFFLSYIVFVYFVLLNVFLAIVNDNYSDVKSRQSSNYLLTDFLASGMNNLRGVLGIVDRSVDVKNAIKVAAADDGFVTHAELRDLLRRSRFSDVEIELFFHRFQRDPVISKVMLDDQEVLAMQLKQEKRRRSLIEGDETCNEHDDSDIDDFEFDSENKVIRPTSGKEARSMRSERQRFRREEAVSDEEYYALQEQLTSMERSVLPLLQHLSGRLRVLGVDDVGAKTQHVGKMNRASMEQLFDQIIQSDHGDAMGANAVLMA